MVSAIRSRWIWIIVFILIFPFVTIFIMFLSLLSADSMCVVSLSNLKLFIIIHIFSSGRRLLL